MRSESGKPRVLLDTKPLIRLFAREEGWEAVQKIMSQIEVGEVEAAISVVTLTEIYYKYLQEKRPDLAKARTEEIRYATYLGKHEIDEEVAVRAGELKGRYNIPIADAFIAAAAHLEGLMVISDDAEFKRIHEIKTLTENEFVSRLSR